MRVSILAFSASLLTLSTVSAAPAEFPYEAVVQNDGVIVRSGPGERYDPTLKLSSGQRLTVHRHDPGGWFMIAPPEGSFSWIDASYVETAGDGRGVVKVPPQGGGLPPRVVVWIGSQFTNEHKYFGRQLATGDDVTILGEETRPTERGPTKFYKIQPPRLEYRWVKGDYVLPLSEAGHIAQKTSAQPQAFDVSAVSDDPFAGPLLSDTAASPPGFPAEEGPTLLERKLDRAIDSNAVAKSGPSSAELDQSRSRLSELDEHLRVMLDQGPAYWRLDEMAQTYRALQASASPGVAGMIDTRLDTIEARRPIKTEYDAFVAITARTNQRDAELLGLQSADVSGAPAGLNVVQLGASQQLPPGAQPPTAAPQVIGGPVPSPPGGNGAAIPPGSAAEVDLNQLAGAGIISRLPTPRPGVPPHILVSPDGRMLAYLHADRGINLDAHLGQSVGIIGQRTQEATLRSDLIIVQQLTPVRLQP